MLAGCRGRTHDPPFNAIDLRRKSVARAPLVERPGRLHRAEHRIKPVAAGLVLDLAAHPSRKIDPDRKRMRAFGERRHHRPSRGKAGGVLSRRIIALV